MHSVHFSCTSFICWIKRLWEKVKAQGDVHGHMSSRLIKTWPLNKTFIFWKVKIRLRTDHTILVSSFYTQVALKYKWGDWDMHRISLLSEILHSCLLHIEQTCIVCSRVSVGQTEKVKALTVCHHMLLPWRRCSNENAVYCCFIILLLPHVFFFFWLFSHHTLL